MLHDTKPRAIRRYVRNIHSCILLTLTLPFFFAACTMPASEVMGTSELESPEGDAREDDSAWLESTESVETSRGDLSLTELTFEGNGDTFLERVDEAATSLAEPVEHYFVEVTDAEGTPWQGELLVGADGGILLLQAEGHGSAHGVQIELTKEAALDETLLEQIAASLPTVDAAAAAPDVSIEFVRARQSAPGIWSFDVTLNHPDTGWSDYTDGWHIATEEGTILGTRILLHPHENEMPFTRSLGSVTVPEGTTEILIRAHDLVSGYDPNTVAIPLTENATTDQYEVILN